MLSPQGQLLHGPGQCPHTRMVAQRSRYCDSFREISKYLNTASGFFKSLCELNLTRPQ